MDSRDVDIRFDDIWGILTNGGDDPETIQHRFEGWVAGLLLMDAAFERFDNNPRVGGQSALKIREFVGQVSRGSRNADYEDTFPYLNDSGDGC